MARERIAVAHASQFDQFARATRRARHRLDGGGVGDTAARRHNRPFAGGEGSLSDADGDVAAEDLACVGGEAGAERLRRRAGGGDRRDA